MTDALDGGQRSHLEGLVGKARSLLEADLADQAAGRFGIDPDGTVAEEAELRLDPAALAARRDLVDVVTHLRSEGNDPQAAVVRLLREAVFTHLNRLVAIRIAEALDLLVPSLAAGRRSQGFRDLLELTPLLAGDATGGYWTYLQLCGDELAGDVPALFDPRNPLLSLGPSPRALDELVELLAETTAPELWAAPDCLGWVYQFFNTADERRAMREGSGAPSNSRELAVRNQFFTPRYVVDFLVQNSLGRRLMDAEPSSPLLEDLPLLLDPPAKQGSRLSLDEVSVLDPACGSGHFLLAAYDVLERAWHHAGVQASEAAPSIVRSLWGIDIDPRCTQVAAAALIFRARRSCPEGELPRPNIVCARSLPPTSTGLEELLVALPDSQRGLVERITEALVDAPILGSLLRIEEHLAIEVRAAAFGGPAPAGTLADALPDEMLQGLEEDLLTNLSKIADATTATPAERLLAAEADDAIRFVHALQRRYDAVLMNPPFGEPVTETKPYLKATYPWIPTKDYNLLAAFVGRGLELCKPAGFVGAITSRAGMFLKTYERWREDVLLRHRLVALADLGYGVMEQALVEAAAYVVGAAKAEPGHRATFVRLLKDVDRPAGLNAAVRASRDAISDHRVYEVALEDLRAVPGSPVAYWMSPSVRGLFSTYPPVEGYAGEARQGLATGDDFRFLRAFWEVNPRNIGRSRQELQTGRRWAPFAKGGEYSPYWADLHLVINYENDGAKLRSFPGSVIRNPQYYFRPGLTWPPRTNSGFGVRVLPDGCVFGHKGPAVFVNDADPLATLAWLNSRLVQASIDAMVAAGEEVSSGGASRSYEVGLVQKLPWVPALDTSEELRALAGRLVELRRAEDRTDETTRAFIAPDVLQFITNGESFTEAVEANVCERYERCLEILRISLQAEGEMHRIAGLDADGLAYLDNEVGHHPAAYAIGDLDEIRFTQLYHAPINAVIDEVVDEKGGSRAIANLTYFADRRLEVLAHTFERPAQQIAAVREKLRLIPPQEVARSADQLLSYLVGACFGRWDVRVLGDARPRVNHLEPFAPVPLCPPGALVDDRGLPTLQAPGEYPLELPSAGLLVDQPGHVWDIEERLLNVAATLLADSERVVTEMLTILKRRGVRDYLRKQFFKIHLSRYSKSRRNAPIYWPLYVPSGNWGVWVYAPTLSRETIFAIVRAAAERLDGAEGEIRRLRSERDSGGAGRSARDVANALGSEEALADELRRFRDEAGRVAGLGWEPDLDDGIILCAAPLADLVPAWKDAAATREEIRAGAYPWSAVSKWAEQL